MVLDHHVHTQFNGFSTVDAFKAADRAVLEGIKVLGFAENFPLPAAFALTIEGEDYMPPEDLPHYIDTARGVRASYDRDVLDVLIGVEVDYLPRHRAETLSRLERLGEHLDFRLLGLHFIGAYSLSLSRPVMLEAIKLRYGGTGTREFDALHREYYAWLAEAVATGAFDVLGHFDLSKKFDGRGGEELAERFRPEIEAVLDQVAKTKHMAIELNLSGLNMYCREPFPCYTILEWAREREIPLTLSSDAQDESHLARNYDLAREWFIKLDVEELAFYRRRTRQHMAVDAWIQSSTV